MSDTGGLQVAIVDYGMGNLFSIKQACESVGLKASLASSPQELLAAAAVIVPGVGAFGDAMAALHHLDLVEALREVAHTGRPLIGICLGLQLLMTKSFEFGCHEGLDLIPGEVVRLTEEPGAGQRFKVPQVGWNSIHPGKDQRWADSLLAGLREGDFMYFVHSFYAKPEDPRVVCAVTHYGPLPFCSSLRCGNIFATQFHPERSGPQGLRIYQNLAAQLTRSYPEVSHV